MIFDAQSMLSPDQSMVGASGTILSINCIDVPTSSHDLSRGGGLRGWVEVKADLVGGTSIQVQYVESDDVAFFSPNVLLSGRQVLIDGARAGTRIFDQLVPSSRRRFIGFRYVIIGMITAGSLRGGLVANTPYNPSLPAATGR